MHEHAPVQHSYGEQNWDRKRYSHSLGIPPRNVVSHSLIDDSGVRLCPPSLSANGVFRPEPDFSADGRVQADGEIDASPWDTISGPRQEQPECRDDRHWASTFGTDF